MKHELYDVVRVVAINNQQIFETNAFSLRLPKVGDVAAIVEIYGDPSGYELECCDESGITLWLRGFTEADIELESLRVLN